MKFKAWSKRMIWYVIIMGFDILGDLVHYTIYHKPQELEYPFALVWLGMLIIPMLMMKDDE